MADLPVGSTARSKYRFEAEHPTELSLEPGELVTVLEPSRQDWTYCSRVSRPSEKGAAPSNYLEAATSASSRNPTGVVSSSRQQQQQHNSNTNNSSTAPSPLASSRGAPTPLNNNPTNSRNINNQNTSLMSTGTVTASSNRASPIPTTNNNNSQHRRHNSQSSAALISMTPAQNALLEGFQKNELYFQQLLAQRQEVNANLDSALREAATEIDAAKDKHSAMERRLKELDNTINKERKRWKDRVEEERMLLAQRTGNAAPGNASVVEYSSVTTTTTTRPQPQSSTTNNTNRAIGGGAAGASRYGGGR